MTKDRNRRNNCVFIKGEIIFDKKEVENNSKRGSHVGAGVRGTRVCSWKVEPKPCPANTGFLSYVRPGGLPTWCAPMQCGQKVASWLWGPHCLWLQAANFPAVHHKNTTVFYVCHDLKKAGKHYLSEELGYPSR